MTRHPSTTTMQRVLSALIEPSPAFRERDVRRQIRILSAMLMFLVFVSVYSAYIFYRASGRYWKETLSATGVLLPLYLVSRTGHARLVTWMVCPVVHVLLFILLLPNMSREGHLFFLFLVIPVLLSTLFLSIWPAVANGLVAVGLMLAYHFLVGDVRSGRFIPFDFVWIVSALIVFVAHHRNLLEADRRTDLIQALEQKAAGERLLEQANDRLRIEQLQNRTAVLEGRNHLAREMHDGLAQCFTGILFQIDAALGLLSSSAPATREHLERARQWGHRGAVEAREAITALRSSIASTSVLAERLRQHAQMLVEGDAVALELRAGGDAPLAVKVGAALLRVGQEALANAVRHGRPRHVRVDVELGAETITLRVQDDGCGFHPEETAGTPGFGLLGMRERVEALGGRLSVDSRPGGGTTVLASIPLEAASP